MFKWVKIQAGIPKAYNDVNSSEQGIIASLTLTGRDTDIALEPVEGWIPKIAQSKGGVWSDNESSDGRTLHGINEQNVNEEMTAFATAATVKGLALVLVDLNRMVELTRDFWQTSQQIEPVYINVWFEGAPGPQYALIHNMNVTETMDRDNPASRTLTIAIEREPFWRVLPPGSNPKIWSFERLGQKPGIDYDLADLALVEGTGHLASSTTMRNICEHTPVTTATTILTKNWLDIDKDLIAGDAPALVSVGLKADIDIVTRFYMGVSHLPDSLPDESGGAINQFVSLNTLDQSSNTGTKTTDATCGIEQVIASGHGYGALSLTAGSDDTYEWDGSTVPLTMQLLRGHWMAFVRAGYDHSTQDLVSAQLDILVPSSLNASVSQEAVTVGIVNIPGSGGGWPIGAGVTCEFGFTYIGEFRLPIGDGVNATMEGTGVYVGESQTNADMEFQLKFTNNDASTRIITSLDIIFIPVGDSTSLTIGYVWSDRSAIVDSSGYLAHGKPQDIAQTNVDDVSLHDIIFQNELRGNGVKLEPGQDNRIYLLTHRILSNLSQSSSNIVHEMYVNIIPRWRGIRDV
jgi:hypothetical protein